MKRILLLCFVLFAALAWSADDVQVYDAQGRPVKAGRTAGIQISAVAAASHTATATNADATVTIASAGVNIRNVVDGVAWSYSGGTPTGGRLVIKDGATIVFDEDITTAGAGFFPVLREGSQNTALTIVLYDGGAAIVGKVNVSRLYVK